MYFCLNIRNLIGNQTGFKDDGVEFVALENNIDTTTPLGMVLFSMCAAFSEMERELIRARIKAVLDAAHKKRRRGGGPKSMTASKLKMLLSLKKSEGFSVTQICNMVGITRSVYYREINKNKETVASLKRAS